ncbi:disease resistance protein RPV1-like [Cornus florida]|uniref:disease resistance protein RPV1-like n=1 Tax=Cornus florida TaxID=4283 RepID=UPI0028A0A805|nr:disease resistance protein RPV1-like [Cornus florida]
MAASCVYDVFLSFSGLDTRKTFTGHLLAALDQHGFYTFSDDTKLPRGEEVGPELLKVIKESRVSVIVFSKNYASSRWCLDELIKIMDCKRTLHQIVIPVFYDVQPSDVRSQSGCYAEAFAGHKKEFDLKKVEIWRLALEKAGNLSGYVLQNVANGCESTCIKSVIGGVAEKLNPTGLSDPEYQVGIEHSVEQVTKFLTLGSNSISNDVRIVAIWGIGGIGKTTIAKVLYNRIHRFHPFERTSFLHNVGRTSRDIDNVVKLQKQLLSDLLNDENEKIRCGDHGIEVRKCRAWRRRVLLVLDGVDNDSQLSVLAINRNWLRPGSRIVVTTRDLSAIKSLQVDDVYNLEELNKEESLQLFSCLAFRRDCPLEGSLLSGKAVPKWHAQLEKLKKIPDPKVQDILRQSFDSLDDKQKGLFLDIACFFVGMDQDLAIKILKDCDFYPDIDIDILSDRCLVSIVRIDRRHNQLMMHDLIQDMAKEIVYQESPTKPGERNRLWYHKDILDLLRYDTGTENILGLVLNLPESEELQVNAEAFTKMKSLRLLHFNYVQVLCKLKYLNLSHSYLLMKTLDFTGLTGLEKLLLTDCTKLVEVHQSIERLEDLIVLDLNNCKNLKKIPQSIFMLKSLAHFNISGCSKLEWPAFFRRSPPESSFSSLQLSSSIRKLSMENCNITNVPSEIGSLVSLESLNLSRNKFSNLPATITSLPLLEYLCVNKCTLLESLPSLPVNLRILGADDCTSLQSMSIESKAAQTQMQLKRSSWNLAFTRKREINHNFTFCIVYRYFYISPFYISANLIEIGSFFFISQRLR